MKQVKQNQTFKDELIRKAAFKIARKQVEILDKEWREKEDKWLEERSRMVKLLFKKGIKSW